VCDGKKIVDDILQEWGKKEAKALVCDLKKNTYTETISRIEILTLFLNSNRSLRNIPFRSIVKAEYIYKYIPVFQMERR
jgi:hypothetical protein